MAEGKTIKVTLIKSPIGCIPKQKATVEAMGFHKLLQTKELPDNPSTRGMIHKISHLVKVEEA